MKRDAGRSTAIRKRARARFKRLGLACHICGRPIDYAAPYPHPESFVMDHIVPLARGGIDAIDNLTPAHAGCNAIKGDRVHAAIVKTTATLA